MNRNQVFIAAAIAVAGIISSTVVTVAYLNGKQPAPTGQNPSPEPSIVGTSPSPEPTAPVSETPEATTPTTQTPASPTTPPLEQPTTPTTQTPSSSTTPTTTTPSSSTKPNSHSTTPGSKKTSEPTGNGKKPLPASQFSQFRLRLLNAVQRRDAKFIRAIVTEETEGQKGSKLNLDSYKINDSRSQLWAGMEKAVSAGCAIDSTAQVADKDAGSSVWVCPNLTKLNQSQQPDNNGSKQLAILGQKVNLRVDPWAASRIVGVVSNEYVTFDQDAFNKLPVKQQKDFERYVLDGWTPVKLSNGQHGWVQNRYVYNEGKDYRVSFVRSHGQWRLRYFSPSV